MQASTEHELSVCLDCTKLKVHTDRGERVPWILLNLRLTRPLSLWALHFQGPHTERLAIFTKALRSYTHPPRITTSPWAQGCCRVLRGRIRMSEVPL